MLKFILFRGFSKKAYRIKMLAHFFARKSLNLGIILATGSIS